MVNPAVDFPDELTSQQRAAIVIYHLGVLGRKYTTDEIGRLTGLTYFGAAHLMDKLSSAYGVPVCKLDGRWVILPEG